METKQNNFVEKSFFREGRLVFVEVPETDIPPVSEKMNILDELQSKNDQCLEDLFGGRKLYEMDFSSPEWLNSLPEEVLGKLDGFRGKFGKVFGDSKNEILDALTSTAIKNAYFEKQKNVKKSVGEKILAKVGGDKRTDKKVDKILGGLRSGSITDAKYQKVYAQEVAKLAKIQIFSKKSIEDKYGKDISNLRGISDRSLRLAMTRVMPLIADFDKFAYGWKEDATSRVLLGYLTSTKYQKYLKEIKSDGTVSVAEITKADTDQITAKGKLDTSRVDFDAKVKAENQAKKELKDAEKMFQAKEKMKILRDEREQIKNKNPNIFTKLKSKVHQKTHSDVKQIEQEMATNSRGIIALGKLFYGKTIGSVAIGGAPGDPDDVINDFLNAGGAVNPALSSSELEEQKELAKRKLEDATREKESSGEINSSAQSEFTKKYNYWRQLKTNKESAKIENKKMSLRELLVVLKTKSFDDNLKSTIPDKIKRKIKSEAMATVAVNSEINNVENKTSQSELKKQAEKKMAERNWKEGWQGKTLRPVGAVGSLGKDKEGKNRGMKVLKHTGNLVWNIMADVGVSLKPATPPIRSWNKKLK